MQLPRVTMIDISLLLNDLLLESLLGMDSFLLTRPGHHGDDCEALMIANLIILPAISGVGPSHRRDVWLNPR